MRFQRWFKFIVAVYIGWWVLGNLLPVFNDLVVSVEKEEVSFFFQQPRSNVPTTCKMMTFLYLQSKTKIRNCCTLLKSIACSFRAVSSIYCSTQHSIPFLISHSWMSLLAGHIFNWISIQFQNGNYIPRMCQPALCSL